MRQRLNWQYDNDKQEFLTPSGRRISLREIAGTLHDLAECRIDLQGPWSGWRIRGNELIPPSGQARARFKPHNLAAFLRWASPQRPIRDAANTTHRRSDGTQLRVHRTAHLDDIPADALHIVSELVTGALDRLLRSL